MSDEVKEAKKCCDLPVGVTHWHKVEKKDDNVVEEVEFVQGGKTEETNPTPDKTWKKEELQAELKKRETSLNNTVEHINKLRRQYSELQQIATVTRGAVIQLKELLK